MNMYHCSVLFFLGAFGPCLKEKKGYFLFVCFYIDGCCYCYHEDVDTTDDVDDDDTDERTAQLE